jgi:hypothetical protein
MRSGRREVMFLNGTSVDAVPGGGPIVQPLVWRPHVSHRRNKRLGSRASVSSCPRNRQRSLEGVNDQRDSVHIGLSHFAVDGRRGRTVARAGVVRPMVASQLTRIARLPITSASVGVYESGTSTPGLDDSTTATNTRPHTGPLMPRLCHGPWQMSVHNSTGTVEVREVTGSAGNDRRQPLIAA